ncbi:ML domain-containing protein [Mycena belliarum]|uniref:Phosphatidylglycerol/phosphatidylinositol transfer protein n=1 Tax=Mycena belliarum TaxID=1033014 RepID=A0AAD6TSQ4_9AGAR|nr:ML domain-containing protein [Mycena belliae]
MHLPLIPSALLFAFALLLPVSGSAAQQRLRSPLRLDLSPGVVATTVTWAYDDCGTDTVFRLTSLTLSPDPPIPGQNLTLAVEGDVREAIEDGAYADITIKFGLIRLLQKTFDICDEARKANFSITCPVSEGVHQVVEKVILPKAREIPRGKFTVQVRAYTKDDAELLCLNIEADFRGR